MAPNDRHFIICSQPQGQWLGLGSAGQVFRPHGCSHRVLAAASGLPGTRSTRPVGASAQSRPPPSAERSPESTRAAGGLCSRRAGQAVSWVLEEQPPRGSRAVTAHPSGAVASLLVASACPQKEEESPHTCRLSRTRKSQTHAAGVLSRVSPLPSDPGRPRTAVNKLPANRS